MELKLNNNTRFARVITTSNKNSITLFVDGDTIK